MLYNLINCFIRIYSHLSKLILVLSILNVLLEYIYLPTKVNVSLEYINFGYLNTTYYANIDAFLMLSATHMVKIMLT